MPDHIRPETDSLIAYLNDLLRTDPEMVQQLVAFRVPCSQAIADHPTVQVHVPPDETQPTFVVGILGLLNGYCGVFPQGHPFAGYGPIAAVYQGARLVAFERMDQPHRMVPALTRPGAVAKVG